MILKSVQFYYFCSIHSICTNALAHFLVSKLFINVFKSVVRVNIRIIMYWSIRCHSIRFEITQKIICFQTLPRSSIDIGIEKNLFSLFSTAGNFCAIFWLTTKTLLMINTSTETFDWQKRFVLVSDTQFKKIYHGIFKI